MALVKQKQPICNARPDSLDFRDKMFEAGLFEVPTKIDLEEYMQWNVPILNQGVEGACTGFGLATVCNYLLRRRKVMPSNDVVSARMLYEMAKRYDEWPDENYDGSSARGAMKGWNKHGVCSSEHWPYDSKSKRGCLNQKRIEDALKRPLGAYYRVNHQDLISMHSALAEVGILYVTCTIHQGWNEVGSDGIISISQIVLGGHAFAIVGYDDRGFWIQNSWGENWGYKGFGKISYDDWLQNATDVWVARLGAPIITTQPLSSFSGNAVANAASKARDYAELRPHIISIGNNGKLKTTGDYGTTEEMVKTIFTEDFQRVTKSWPKKRILLYAHGGLVGEGAAIQRLAEYRTALIEAQIYPISFIWHSDAWTTITNVLQDAIKRMRPEGFIDSAKDFMLDRLDDILEPLARNFTGKLMWSEMKENAMMATTSSNGGARLVLTYVAQLAKQYGKDFEINIVGHSAGSIFHAPIVQLITSTGKIANGPMKGATGFGLPINSITLWAPAITINLFKQTYLSAIQNSIAKSFALFIMTDKTERDDNCAKIYNKSLLYLVSNAFEDNIRNPFEKDGTPILGLEKFVNKDNELTQLFKTKKADLVLSPNTEAIGNVNASQSTSHGGFDDDSYTVKATLNRMLNIQLQPAGKAETANPNTIKKVAKGKRLKSAKTFSASAAIQFNTSAGSQKAIRLNLESI